VPAEAGVLGAEPPRVTSAHVVALRRSFGMTREQFALLLGVSEPTIRNWETARGELRLHERTLAAWATASLLTRQEAWELLRDL
jgi:DNA-binding transcriptional regulator YiaG